MALTRVLDGAFKDTKSILVTLQWLVVICTSYLSLFNEGEVVEDPLVFTLVAVLIFSGLVLRRLPQAAFEHPYFAHLLVILDTILIACGIGLNRNNPWDLFLLFFAAIFIAALGETLIRIVMASLVVSVIFILAAQVQDAGFSKLGSDALLRIPFVFGVSILYGYMAEQNNKETRRIKEEGERIKSEFLSVISHELRTPLNIVINYASMMKKGLFGDLNQQQQRALEKVIKNSRELFTMIDDLLEVARLGAVKLESHLVSLKDFLDEVRSHYDIPLDKQVKIVWDYSPELPVIKTDAGKLKHILWNLINNGVKFTETGEVAVSVRHFPDFRRLELKVSDTGIGIPESDLASIFEMFHQSDSSSERTYGGVGLGLHIVKKFTEMLDGEVAVKSEVNKGSTFTVTVPYDT